MPRGACPRSRISRALGRPPSSSAIAASTRFGNPVVVNSNGWNPADRRHPVRSPGRHRRGVDGCTTSSPIADNPSRASTWALLSRASASSLRRRTSAPERPDVVVEWIADTDTRREGIGRAGEQLGLEPADLDHIGRDRAVIDGIDPLRDRMVDLPVGPLLLDVHAERQFAGVDTVGDLVADPRRLARRPRTPTADAPPRSA